MDWDENEETCGENPSIWAIIFGKGAREEKATELTNSLRRGWPAHDINVEDVHS
jgi:hypothetical protein